MGHQRFETWLLAEEPLKPEQQIELQDHLENCSTCQALSDSWQTVEHHLSVSAQIAPLPGFTTRWEARLEAARSQAERRTNLVILAFSSAGAVMLLALMVLQLFFTFESPAEFLLVSANQVTRVFSGFNVTMEILAAMVKAIPEIILVGLWVGTTGLAVMSVLWIISIHQSTFQRRILQ